MVWLALWLACGVESDDDATKKAPAPDDDTALPSATDDTGPASTDTETDTDSAWWVDTGWDSGHGSVDTDEGTYNPYPYYPYTTAALEDSGFFDDSGVTCSWSPNLDPVVLPTTWDEALASLPFDAGADRDGDGFVAAGDCDDADPYVFPGAPERCDGVDTDCDPLTAEVGLVTVDGVATYGSWRDAAMAASPGSVMVLCPGTHEGPVWMRDDVTMVGLEGAAETILTAGTSNRNLLRMQRGNLLLQGVTLRGADVDGAMTLPVRDPQTFWPAGGALSVGECGSIVARDVVIEDNAHYGDGAGVGSAGGPIYLFDAVLQRNAALASAGVHAEGLLHLERVTVVENTCDEPGESAVYGLSGVDAQALSLLDNECNGILAQAGDAYVEGLVTTGNLGGATLLGAEVTVRGCHVEGNDGSGGLDLTGGTVLVEDCTLIGNVGSVHGGLQIDGDDLQLVSSVIDGNNGVEGGGLYVDGDLVLTDVSIVGNAAQLGGGVYVDGTVLADQVSVEGNVADLGGGIAVVDGSWSGGVLSGNEANRGGGAALLGDSVALEDVAVEDNDAMVHGGGVYVTGFLAEVNAVDFAGNSAPDGGTLSMGPAAGMACVDCEQGDGVGDVWTVASASSWTWNGVPSFLCDGWGCDVLPHVDVGVGRTLLRAGAGVEVAVGDPHVAVYDPADQSLAAWHLVDGVWRAEEVPHTGDAPVSLATAADLLVVGTDATTVQLYRFDGSAWIHEHELVRPTGMALAAAFGAGVATDGTSVAIGAPGEEVDYEMGSGTIFVHEQVGGVWTEVAVLEHTAYADQALGRVMAMAPERLVAGLPNRVSGVFAGRVVRFERVAGVWTEMWHQRSLSWDELVGAHVDIDGDYVVSSLGHDDEDPSGVIVWDDAGAVVLRTDDTERFGVPVGNVVLEGGAVAYGMPAANQYAYGTGIVALHPSGLGSEPLHIADDAWQADQGFGEHVGMVGDSLIVLDTEGIWALTPDSGW